MNPHLHRQIDHWRAATQRLGDLNKVASPAAWALLERLTDTALRARLDNSLQTLRGRADRLHYLYQQGRTSERDLRKELQELRSDYLRTEVTLDYFGDAVNTRTDGLLGGHLKALDIVAATAMRQVLQPLGYLVPPVMTYIDKGLGASILKAGLRLWDQRGVNPVAVIKVVRHNLYRPTALIHEAGHQIAYAIGWNQELALALEKGLSGYGRSTAKIWSSWSSEIAADAFAFIFTGYAAVATLQDVLSGSNGLVFQFHHGDPHPIPYVRTLLGVAMCRAVFGNGPWDELEADWLRNYPLTAAPDSLQPWLANAPEHAKAAAQLVLRQPMQAFGGRSLTALLPPDHLQPGRLLAWGARQGPVAGWSDADLHRHTLPLLALSVYQQVTESQQNTAFRNEMDRWFQRLGNRRGQLIYH